MADETKLTFQDAGERLLWGMVVAALLGAGEYMGLYSLADDAVYAERKRT